MSTTVDSPAPAPPTSSPPTTSPPAAPAPLSPEYHHDQHDAYRDVLLAAQRALAANWHEDRPRIAVIERNGLASVYVSTTRTLEASVRFDVRGAVRAALAPYVPLAPYTNVIFLRRLTP